MTDIVAADFEFARCVPPGNTYLTFYMPSCLDPRSAEYGKQQPELFIHLGDDVTGKM